MKTLLTTLLILISFNIYSQFSITCPDDVYQPTDDENCTAQVFGLDPVLESMFTIESLTWQLITEDDTINSPQTGKNSITGYHFPRHIETESYVIYTLKNMLGGSVSCSFNLDIYDKEAPSFTMVNSCDTTVFDVDETCIYENFASLPDQGYMLDLVVETIDDNCGGYYDEPFEIEVTANWYGAYETYAVWVCAVEDGSGNVNVQFETFWYEYYEKEAQPKLAVYPNPSFGNFTVNKEYKIYDFRGELQTEPLKSGMYILKSGNEQIKLIIK